MQQSRRISVEGFEMHCIFALFMGDYVQLCMNQPLLRAEHVWPF
jgi:hypothetical protein